MVALCIFLGLTASAEAACAVSDVEIKSWTWNRDAGWFTISGEFVNNCAEPTGVQLQLTFRDESGRVVTVEDSWAAGTRNIKSRETYAFRISTRGYVTGKSIALRVVNVRQWPAS
jgi:hypothetical protein